MDQDLDVEVVDHGSVVVLVGVSAEGRGVIEEYRALGVPAWCDGVAIDRSAAGAVLDGLSARGAVWGVRP